MDWRLDRITDLAEHVLMRNPQLDEESKADLEYIQMYAESLQEETGGNDDSKH